MPKKNSFTIPSLVDRSKDSTFLVTGAAGFSGSYFIAYLLLFLPESKIIAIDIIEDINIFYERIDYAISIYRDICERLGYKTNSMNISRKNIKYSTINISSPDTPSLLKSLVNLESIKFLVCVHFAALVGPFYSNYDEINRIGTRNVYTGFLQCLEKGVRGVFIDITSPSTRFSMDDLDILNKTEEELNSRLESYGVDRFPFVHEYARTKYMGELEILNHPTTSTNHPPFVAYVAPHQLYGPGDKLFIPNMREKERFLTIFGSGSNLVSICFITDFIYGIFKVIESGIDETIPNFNFFIICSEYPVSLWKFINEFLSIDLYDRIKVPFSLLKILALIGDGLCRISCGKIQLRLNTFTLNMLSINRVFNSDKVRNFCSFKEIVGTDMGIEITRDWLSR